MKREGSGNLNSAKSRKQSCRKDKENPRFRFTSCLHETEAGIFNCFMLDRIELR